jgi:hypothetical protein
MYGGGGDSDIEVVNKTYCANVTCSYYTSLLLMYVGGSDGDIEVVNKTCCANVTCSYYTITDVCWRQ